jgi:NADH-quinone oxidoreductase subunit M
MIAFLILESMMVGMFCALDLCIFYIFFEGRVDPDVHHHRRLGRPRRIYAAFKFFLYTLLGSVLMLLALLAMYLEGRHDRHHELLTTGSRSTCRRGCGWRSSPRSR